MLFTDSSRGYNFAKDPIVIKFSNKYFMYYSIGPYKDNRPNNPWSIGIATSDDLETWTKIGEILPQNKIEKNGICAPGAIVINDKVHLFYQTYGNGMKDAICYAVSDDGINFERFSNSHIFAPKGDWCNGRAIDADVILFNDVLFLYFATRDKTGTIQKIGVATADINKFLVNPYFEQACDNSILEPTLPWEKNCIEAPAVCLHNNNIYMFYGGGYNNEPQQIGCAKSSDGIHFSRVSLTPILENGKKGTWNESESGHPGIFSDENKTYLFFQGNNDMGKTWYISMKEILWHNDIPN